MPVDIATVVEKAREQLSEFTGLELSSTLGVVPNEKGWRVLVEMVEKHSLPDSMDLLALYEVFTDKEGNTLEFNRKKMRKRVDVYEEDEE